MTVEAASVKVVQPEQVARRRPERLRKRTDRSRLASVGLHGALVVASLIAVFPVFWVLVTSFKPDAKAVETTPKLVNDSSLDNYVRILAGDKGDFLAWFGNSVLIALMTTVLAVFLSATTGYAASRFRFPGKRSLMLSFLVVQMFPFAVLIVPLYNILLVLGLQGTSMGLVLVYCTTAVPFCTYMLKATSTPSRTTSTRPGGWTACRRSVCSGGSCCHWPARDSP